MVKEYVGPDHAMQQGNQPEDELIGQFSNFVLQRQLGQQAAGPAAQQFDKVQGRFRCAPLTSDRFSFIPVVGNETNHTHHAICAQNAIWGEEISISLGLQEVI